MKKQGYSLVELLVTLSIVGVFLAVILPGFRSSAPEKSVEQAALEVQSAIKEAHNLAYTETTGVSSYIIVFSKTSPDNNQVKIYAVDTTGTDRLKKTFTLPAETYVNNITFKCDHVTPCNTGTFTPNPGYINFSTTSTAIKFNGKSYLFESPQNLAIEIKNNKSSTKANIYIDPVTARTLIDIGSY